MKNGFFILLAAALCSCASGGKDTIRGSRPSIGLDTRINFFPPTRAEALRNLEIEREVHRSHVAPIESRIAVLERGRAERYGEVAKEFPECRRQKHCVSSLSKGSVRKFERYGELAKEINEYDTRIAELEGAKGEWDWRYSIRQRAILNRFLVHEILGIPQISGRFQGILVHSLESYPTRRDLSYRLIQLAGHDLVPSVVGDLDFQMLGKPVDEGAVLATFDVYLTPPSGAEADPQAPTRFVVTMLVNTHQLDLRYYDNELLRIWAEFLEEPFQRRLRQNIPCSIYSIAGRTLLPKLPPANRARACSPLREEMQSLAADNFGVRNRPEKWMLPLAYFPMAVAGGSRR